ncbi:hypothetical protein THF5H11_260016 [Vibrio jasicida]|nr:hypothetical protein THF5H11_260016 [Vibrio jasicida]
MANASPDKGHPNTLIIPNQSKNQDDYQPVGKDVGRSAMFNVTPESFGQNSILTPTGYELIKAMKE